MYDGPGDFMCTEKEEDVGVGAGEIPNITGITKFKCDHCEDTKRCSCHECNVPGAHGICQFCLNDD